MPDLSDGVAIYEGDQARQQSGSLLSDAGNSRLAALRTGRRSCILVALARAIRSIAATGARPGPF